jgi:hypothetical protein
MVKLSTLASKKVEGRGNLGEKEQSLLTKSSSNTMALMYAQIALGKRRQRL